MKLSQRERRKRDQVARQRIPTGRPVAFGLGSLPASLADIEKAHILGTLRWAGGNRDVAAIALGIERRTLDGRLRRHLKRGMKG